MPRTPQIAAFPWSALDVVEAAAEAGLWRARRFLEATATPQHFAEALGQLLGLEVRLFRHSIRSRGVTGEWLKLGFEVHANGMSCVVGLEPALAAALLSALLRRPVPVQNPSATLDASAAGALSALVVEAARASQASHALRPRPPIATEGAVALQLTVVLASKPYAAVLWVTPPLGAPPKADDAASLSALGELELTLPLVVAVCRSTARTLVSLTRGAALCPGVGSWIDVDGCGRGALVAPGSERGIGVELGPGSRIVLREPTQVALASTEENRMESDEESGPPTLSQAVLDAPLVVRVELGSLSMTAREWAALKTGDVIQTGRRVAEPVLLRAGGRVVAHGELVNVEGELGVRVLDLSSDGAGE
ncbi:MAG: FliM/FliN family flagellar motor switch protein [Polyangiaceae bacterium]